MKRHRMRRWFGAAAAIVAVVLFAASCTKETIVFVERPLFDDPPAGANGFLGYETSEASSAGVTVCGNCHIGEQTRWETTVHASAWEGLQASGGAQSFCENCHTVGPLGNPAADGGWAGTTDPRYYDVQCESCHSAGEAHVENPTNFQPFASIAALDAGGDPVNCGECHEGSHHPFVEEWEQSKHAEVVSFAAANEECAGCHKGQGTLIAWNVNSDYVEKNDPVAQPTTCAVCHDPHGSEFEGQLRFPVNTNSYEAHLCAKCHDRRTEPDPNSSHGLEPHAPETALLQGVAGWIPPNALIQQDTIRGTHGSARNQKLCATCHVQSYTVTDAVTGDFVWASTGHLFTSIPCVDAAGVPVAGDCNYNTTERSWVGCTESGCHGDATAALSALNNARGVIDARAAELMSQILQVDPDPDDNMGEIDATNPTFTVAEGSFFNYHLANFGGNSVSSSTHNPFLTEALLVASIQAMTDQYGVTPMNRVDPNMDYRAELQRIMSKANSHY